VMYECCCGHMRALHCPQDLEAIDVGVNGAAWTLQVYNPEIKISRKTAKGVTAMVVVVAVIVSGSNGVLPSVPTFDPSPYFHDGAFFASHERPALAASTLHSLIALCSLVNAALVTICACAMASTFMFHGQACTFPGSSLSSLNRHKPHRRLLCSGIIIILWALINRIVWPVGSGPYGMSTSPMLARE